MNTVPIAFAFDRNLALQACVALSSLLTNAHEDTFYDIFILHSALIEQDCEMLDRLPKLYGNCRITYREVGAAFSGAFEIRGVTVSTYYRLLIPELIPEYDKILYADVDIIFRLDLADVYNTDLGDNYLAGTYDLGMTHGDDGRKHISSTPGLSQTDYLQAGFIILNSKAIKENGLVEQFKQEAKKKYKYQDQDILNIVCRGRKLIIPCKYNMTDWSFFFFINERELFSSKYADSDINEAISTGNIHFNGHKPWKKYSINFDIWWEYYRKSPYFDEKFYFDFFYHRLNIFDQLSLWKRIKILVRYFVYGKRVI